MKAAIQKLNGCEFRERSLRVKKAVEKKRLEKKKNRFLKQQPDNTNQKHAASRIKHKQVNENKQVK